MRSIEVTSTGQVAVVERCEMHGTERNSSPLPKWLTLLPHRQGD
jgi:hypothetical protein